MTTTAELRSLSAFPWRHARERSRADFVVGCFPLWIPQEIVRAAGAVPVGLYGGGGEVDVSRADSRFQSFVCSIAKTTLELGLREELAGMDGAIFGAICDVARNLASVFQRNFPALHVDYLHYPQSTATPAAIDWFERELARVLAGLSARTGRAATDDALDEAIAAYDRVRAALRALYDLRCASPERLPAHELYALARRATALRAEEALGMLELARAEAELRQPARRDSVRVIVKGAFCEQPPLDLVRTLEEAGLAIVDDDFHLGSRLFDGPIGGGSEPPLRRIARAFVERTHDSPVARALGGRAERLALRTRELRADGVVLLAAKFCEPALLDQPLLRRGLEAAGIPVLRIEFEEKQWTFERVRSEVETFVESLLFD